MSVRHRIGCGRAAARTADVLLLAALASAHAGCQLLLDDIGATSDAAEQSHANDAAAGSESEPEDVDGASEEGDGADADPPGSAQGNHSASMDAGQGLAPLPDAAGGGGDSDSAIAGGRDGGVGGRDGGVGGRDGGVGGRDGEVADAAPAHDSAASGPDADFSCSEPVWWYQDGDEDGFGRSSSRVSACPAPAGKWARSAGDCNDDHGLVHPNQLEYFSEPYQAPDGSESFDYDCSGAEEGNGTQEIMTGCGVLDLAVCVGGGYLPAARPGAPNPVCGSHQKATCQGVVLGVLVCNPEEDTVVEPYWCR